MRHWTPFVIASLLAGCASPDVPLNPSFPLTADDGWREVWAMVDAPKKLRRPVVVMGGYVDPGSAPRQTSNFIRDATGDDRVLLVNTTFDFSFDACRDHLIETIEEAYPSDDPLATVEVDIVAHSMGGLVARYAALEREGGKHVRIGTLYTVSAPHRGSIVADLPFFDSRQHAMRRGSLILQQVDAELDRLPYEIVPYVRLGDTMVGQANAAPWGQNAWWVQNLPGDSPHFNSTNDPRILADILRRLRGEPHYTTTPPAPLPEE